MDECIRISANPKKKNEEEYEKETSHKDRPNGLTYEKDEIIEDFERAGTAAPAFRWIRIAEKRIKIVWNTDHNSYARYLKSDIYGKETFKTMIIGFIDLICTLRAQLNYEEKLDGDFLADDMVREFSKRLQLYFREDN